MLLVKACQGRGPRVVQGRVGEVMWRPYREVGEVEWGTQVKFKGGTCFFFFFPPLSLGLSLFLLICQQRVIPRRA